MKGVLKANKKQILQKIKKKKKMIKNLQSDILIIKEEIESKNLEQFHIMTRIENIADFIKDRYDIVVEEKEKFNIEKMENK